MTTKTLTLPTPRRTPTDAATCVLTSRSTIKHVGPAAAILRFCAPAKAKPKKEVVPVYTKRLPAHRCPFLDRN